MPGTSRSVLRPSHRQPPQNPSNRPDRTSSLGAGATAGILRHAVTGDDGRRFVELFQAIDQSNREGHSIRLPM